MAKLFDKDGNEVEAFTPEELEAKKKEAIDEYVKNNPDKGTELTAAQTALKEAQDKLKEFEEGGGDDDAQKKRLKAEKKTAEDALKTAVEGLTKQMNDMQTNFLAGHKTKMLEKLSGGDPEKKKKIEFEFDQYNEGKKAPANEVELAERMAKAATLATGAAVTPNFMDGMSSAGQRGDSQNGGGGKVQVEESENAKAQRKAFGISDEDAKKFGPESAAAAQ